MLRVWPEKANTRIEINRFPINLKQGPDAAKGRPGHIIDLEWPRPPGHQALTEHPCHWPLDVSPHS